jgi:hypothetical protein
MATKVKSYDPKKVIVNYGGITLSGFEDGTFVEVKPSSDTWTRKVGADGEVVRVRSNDDTSEVTVTLQQVSPSNDYLSGIRIADATTGLGGVLPLSIVDLSGTTVMFFPQAWIKKMPDVSRAKDAGNTQWVFDTGQAASNFVGGVA